MFKNTYQSGFLTILFSIGSKPLLLWRQTVQNGHIKRITDEDVKSLVIELRGLNVATTYITCPPTLKTSLGILDDKDLRRRFRFSNYQSSTRVNPFSCSMPIGLKSSWNMVQFNLADFTLRAFGTNYVETTQVQIHANCRIRRIYFSDRLYPEDELPPEYKLLLPLSKTKPSRVKV